MGFRLAVHPVLLSQEVLEIARGFRMFPASGIPPDFPLTCEKSKPAQMKTFRRGCSHSQVDDAHNGAGLGPVATSTMSAKPACRCEYEKGCCV